MDVKPMVEWWTINSIILVLVQNKNKKTIHTSHIDCFMMELPHKVKLFGETCL